MSPASDPSDAHNADPLASDERAIDAFCEAL